MDRKFLLKKKGVTLIELLVALALMSLLITIAYPIFTFTARYSNIQINESEELNEIRIASAHLSTDIRNSSSVAIGGNGKSLTADAITYSLVEQNGTTILVRNEQGKAIKFNNIHDVQFTAVNGRLISVKLGEEIAANKFTEYKVALRSISYDPIVIQEPTSPPQEFWNNPDYLAWTYNNGSYQYFKRANLKGLVIGTKFYLERPINDSVNSGKVDVTTSADIEIRTNLISMRDTENINLTSTGGKIIANNLTIRNVNNIQLSARGDIELKNSNLTLTKSNSKLALYSDGKIYVNGLSITINKTSTSNAWYYTNNTVQTNNISGTLVKGTINGKSVFNN